MKSFLLMSAIIFQLIFTGNDDKKNPETNKKIDTKTQIINNTVIGIASTITSLGSATAIKELSNNKSNDNKNSNILTTPEIQQQYKDNYNKIKNHLKESIDINENIKIFLVKNRTEKFMNFIKKNINKKDNDKIYLEICDKTNQDKILFSFSSKKISCNFITNIYTQLNQEKTLFSYYSPVTIIDKFYRKLNDKDLEIYLNKLNYFLENIKNQLNIIGDKDIQNKFDGLLNSYGFEVSQQKNQKKTKWYNISTKGLVTIKQDSSYSSSNPFCKIQLKTFQYDKDSNFIHILQNINNFLKVSINKKLSQLVS